MTGVQTCALPIWGRQLESLVWLHLSDWHQQPLANAHDRRIILEKLLLDISLRHEIHPSLKKLDFVVFSGDISFKGDAQEFQDASKVLFSPILELVGVDVPIVFCPGNHDIERNSFSSIPKEWADSAATLGGYDDKLDSMCATDNIVSVLSSPFENYKIFTKSYGQEYQNGKMNFSKIINKTDNKIGISSINTAWHSARYKLLNERNSEINKLWDYGSLKITETQILRAVNDVKDCDLKILVMHHPLNWINEDEQIKISNIIRENFDIVVHGHEHRPDMSRLSGGAGEILIVPAGATYNRRVPSDPRYTNSYNYCSMSLDDFSGEIYHRIWFEEKTKWSSDQRYWSDGKSSFLIPKNFKKNLRSKRSILFEVEKKYALALKKRLVLAAKVELSHASVLIDGERFIESNVRYEFTYEPGEVEKFRFQSRKNKQIDSHANKNVRDRGFVVVECPLEMKKSSKFDIDGAERFEFEMDIGEDESTIIFHYKLIETVRGVWVWTLARYTMDIDINIAEAADFEYEYLPLGGFPALTPTKHKVYTHLGLRSKGRVHLPSQGYLVQWYPKSDLGG